MSLLERVTACNHADPTEFVPFTVAGTRVGWLRHDFAARLRDFGAPFIDDVQGVALQADGADFVTRSAVLDEAVHRLVAAQLLPRYHGERYPVTATVRERALATIDRAAAPGFGLRAFGQHLNGYVRRRGGIWLWIARRAQEKWNYPGKLDQMVAGGLPQDLGLTENLLKECAEEAAIPIALAHRARPVGTVTYCVATPAGLKPDVIYCYDLELPEDFVPRAADGEVESFELWPLERVVATLRDSEEFKPNCALVAIDFLVRHGELGPDDPDYLALVAGLHAHPGLAS